MSVLNVINGMFGFSVAVDALYIVWKRHAIHWNRIAARYAADVSLPTIAERKLQSIILAGGSVAFACYKGIATDGVTEDGLTLRLLPPWSVFHSPLCIPLDDIPVKPTSWYLNSSSYKLSFVGVADIEITPDGELIDWINSHIPGGLETSWNVVREVA